MPVFSKVKAGAAGAGLAGIIVGLIVAGLKSQGVEVSPEMIALMTALIAAGLSFLGGYIRRERVAFK